jgi:hypothetical protein
MLRGEGTEEVREGEAGERDAIGGG